MAMIYPNTMNAPGARTKMSMVLASSGTNLKLKIEPLPSISRMLPSLVSDMVNPIPIPNPSSMDGHTGFFDAKASALPNTMQFTTIRGMKSPKVSYIEGTYACIANCTTVTNEAMTTMKQGMRTLSGMKFLSKEIQRLDIVNTNVVANPIDMPLMALVVVARVGQQPKRSTNMGFSFISPLVKFCQLFIVSSFLDKAVAVGGKAFGGILYCFRESSRTDGGCRDGIYIASVFLHFKIKCGRILAVVL